MRYLSLFSGIEACSVAWTPLGWECVAVAEIEPWPSRALAHHYPDVPNLGDVTKVTEEQIAMLGRIDVVVFGSPCQDLSVAGKRKGLDGARSGLFFTAMQIVGWARQWCDCRFALWENVPGAFSSNKGRDFAAVVDAMAGLEGTGVPPKGWGTEGCALGSEAMVEWSTLDAQWFGVAQRRRRVFALADFGDWRNRPPILLESESVRGDTAPRREAGQDVTHSVAPCLTSSGRGVERTGDTRGQDPVALRGREGGGTAELGGNVAGTLRASGGGGDKPHVLTGLQRPVLSASTGDVSHCLNAGGMGRIDYETETMIVTSEVVSPTLMSGSTSPAAHGTGRGTPLVPNVVGTMKACKDSGGWSNSADHAAAGYMVPVRTICVATGQAGAEIGADMAPTLNCNHEAPYVAHPLRGEGFDASEDGAGRGTPLGPVAFAENSRHELRLEGGDGQRTGALSTGGGKPGQGVPMIAFPANLSGTPLVPMFLHTNKGRPDGRRSAHTEMVSVKDIVATLTTDGHAQSAVAVPVAYGIRTANTSSNGWGIQEEVTHTLDCAQGVALRGREGGATAELGDEVQNCLRASSGGGDKPHVLTAMQVRRLTPEECEALQGFPRSYTAIPWRGKPSADGPRYKALGNSMAVPVMRWIGQQIDYAMIWSTP
jgi:DNA (cytosine-5)-methyltransferase 1